MKNSTVKEFLIIFTDPHLTYSPSTLNLFQEMKKRFKVQVISTKPPATFTKNLIIDPDIKYLEIETNYSIFDLIRKVYYIIKSKLSLNSRKYLIKSYLYTPKSRAFISYLKKNTHKEFIAVDFMALWCAQKVGKSAHLLSLEINDECYFYKNIDFKRIESLVIQSEVRLNYLFANNKPKFFIVQNSPKYIDFEPNYRNRNKKDLLYCGSAVLGFGIISCLDFIKDFNEYSLTLIGALPKETKEVIEKYYSDLIDEKRLFIEEKYFSTDVLTQFIDNFRIGFAFYDYFRFSELRTFNYFTAPSGKVFQYLNSGIPIVASNIPSFKFLEDSHCGELVDYLSSYRIKRAIDSIECDYENYAKNAKNLSKINDFAVQIAPFIQHISSC